MVRDARRCRAPHHEGPRSHVSLRPHPEERAKRASRRMKARALRLDAHLHQNALGAVVPDIHLHDLAALDHEAVDVAVAFERRAVEPFAIERADAVDDGLVRTRTNVEAVHLLLDPAIAPRIEAGRPARMIELAPAGEGDDGAGLHVG